jgi:hypothetical protein
MNRPTWNLHGYALNVVRPNVSMIQTRHSLYVMGYVTDRSIHDVPIYHESRPMIVHGTALTVSSAVMHAVRVESMVQMGKKFTNVMRRSVGCSFMRIV